MTTSTTFSNLTSGEVQMNIVERSYLGTYEDVFEQKDSPYFNHNNSVEYFYVSRDGSNIIRSDRGTTHDDTIYKITRLFQTWAMETKRHGKELPDRIYFVFDEDTSSIYCIIFTREVEDEDGNLIQTYKGFSTNKTLLCPVYDIKKSLLEDNISSSVPKRKSKLVRVLTWLSIATLPIMFAGVIMYGNKLYIENLEETMICWGMLGELE